jgi:putative lipoic acid-binding regulatory protein
MRICRSVILYLSLLAGCLAACFIPQATVKHRRISVVLLMSDGNLTIIESSQDALTVRFKYKVNALMGVFDPPEEVDNERETGNFLNALLKFPMRYSFHVVGQTAGDEYKKEIFIAQVRGVLAKNSGEDPDTLIVKVTPRGQKFTRVLIEAQMESVSMIASVYKGLGELDMSVMQF